jgi:hypothetical protein
MDRRTSTNTIAPRGPTRNANVVPPGQAPAAAPLAVRDLGHILAVQDHRITSLVRIDGNGKAECDCARYHKTKQPCAHIIVAARLLGEARP